MNEIEKEIEGIDDKENEKEEVVIKNKPNNHQKIYLITAITIILLAIIVLIIFLLPSNKKEDEKNDISKEISKEEEKDSDSKTRLAYVDCDTNTSLLNVRNSPTGDIIDGISCFQTVTIEEEEEKTENCPKWYKISYTKRGDNYTGYSCSTYIKESTIDEKIYSQVKELIDKANDYHKNSMLGAYCGNASGETKEIEFTSNNSTIKGEYLKSEYNSIEELKKYLLSFLKEDIISQKLELSDYSNKSYYDNYYEIDGSLYCRNYAGKDWNTTYTGNYNFEITNVSDKKIDVRIAYEYLSEETEKCNLDDLSSCSTSQFKYILGEIKMEKEKDNYVITAIDFYE